MDLVAVAAAAVADDGGAAVGADGGEVAGAGDVGAAAPAVAAVANL